MIRCDLHLFVPSLDQEHTGGRSTRGPHLELTAMSGYIYELPTAEPLSFSSCYGDPAGLYVAQVVDTTERRANLRTLLKDAKRNSEKDYLKLVKVRPGLIGAVCGKSVEVLNGELRPWMTTSPHWLG